MTHRAATRAQPDAAASEVLEPGTLVRFVNERSAYFGMTATVDSPDKYMSTVVCVRLTSTGQLISVHLRDFVAVERGRR